MSEAEPTLLYLEADDEITAVVRRVRAAPPGAVVVVAPGRSRATSSAVALRLLAREDRDLAVVGDALTRSLAAEAGLTAYASVEDARHATSAEPQGGEPRRAAIHVVRGTDATDAKLPTVPAPAAAAAGAASPASAGPDAATVAVPVSRPARTRPPRPTPLGRPRTGARRRLLPAALLGTMALLLVGAVVAAAMLLPAATVSVTPVSAPIQARTYAVEVPDPEVLSGTAEAAAAATPTGSYTIQANAAGSVVFFNWTFAPVDVPAGSFVAAGEQAFATQANVTVPRGRLTGAGTIEAGTQAVAVVAAAPGPAANVAAEAIDTVLDGSIDQQLRGFPENPERRVTNPEPTAGGVDTTGTEFVQADVDAAVATLREDLAERAADAVPEDADAIIVPGEPAEPTIEGTDGIVGTRDVASVELRGSQAWTAYRVERSEVERLANDAFVDDATTVPDGHRLLPDATIVTLGPERLEGDTIVVEVEVAGRSAPEIDAEEVRARVAGRTPEEARSVMADLGTVEVDLWPGWVTVVPELDWRVEVRVADLAPVDDPQGGSPGASP